MQKYLHQAQNDTRSTPRSLKQFKGHSPISQPTPWDKNTKSHSSTLIPTSTLLAKFDFKPKNNLKKSLLCTKLPHLSSSIVEEKKCQQQINDEKLSTLAPHHSLNQI